MITKRIRVSARCGLLLAGVLALGTCAVMAQNDGPPPGPGGPGGGQRGRGFDPQRQVEMLTQRLNLTADQQTQVKAVLTEQRQKMEAAMVQKRNQRMEEHGGAPPPPPPGV